MQGSSKKDIPIFIHVLGIGTIISFIFPLIIVPLILTIAVTFPYTISLGKRDGRPRVKLIFLQLFFLIILLILLLIHIPVETREAYL